MEEDGIGARGAEEPPPIAQLSDFELLPDESFTHRVRRSIGRRETASSKRGAPGLCGAGAPSERSRRYSKSSATKRMPT